MHSTIPRVTSVDLDDIDRIAAAAEAADGVAPIDEATRLTLANRPEQVRSWLRDDALVLID